jgi:hypothetical protein
MHPTSFSATPNPPKTDGPSVKLAQFLPALGRPICGDAAAVVVCRARLGSTDHSPERILIRNLVRILRGAPAADGFLEA